MGNIFGFLCSPGQCMDVRVGLCRKLSVYVCVYSPLFYDFSDFVAAICMGFNFCFLLLGICFNLT